MEITTQTDYYGLPEQAPRGVMPSQEKIADALRSASPWQRPMQAGWLTHEHTPGEYTSEDQAAHPGQGMWVGDPEPEKKPHPMHYEDLSDQSWGGM